MVAKRKASPHLSGAGPFPLRWLAVAIVAVLSVPLFLALVLHLPSVQTAVIERLVRQVEREAHVRVHWEGYEWKLLSRLQLNRFRVQSEQKTILECDRAQLRYTWSWSRPLYWQPEELLLEKPVVHLERDSKGRFVLPRLAGQTPLDASNNRVPLWAHLAWPQVRIDSGTIVATQNGQTILTIREVTGALNVRIVHDKDGPKIMIDLGRWQGYVDNPTIAGEWHLSGALAATERALILEGVDVELPGKLQASVKGSVALDSPHDAQLQIDLAHCRVEAFPELRDRIPSVQTLSGPLWLRLESGRCTLDHELHTNVGLWKGSLTTRLGDEAEPRSLQWRTHFSQVRIPGLSPIWESHFCGRLEVDASLDSSPSLPQAQFTIQFEPSQWGEYALTRGTLSGTLSHGVLSIRSDAMHSSMGRFTFSGQADLRGLQSPDHAGSVEVDFHFEDANIEKVAAGVRQRAKGLVQVESKYGSGEFFFPERWVGKIEVNLTLPDFLSVRASGTYRDQEFNIGYTLDSANIAKASAWLPSWKGQGKGASRGSIKGRWPDPVWEGTVSMPKFSYDPFQGEQITLEGKGRFWGKEPQGKLQLKAKSLRIEGKRIGPVAVHLDQKQDIGRFQISAAEVWPKGSVKFSGQLNGLHSFPRILTVDGGQFNWRDRVGSWQGKARLETDRIHLDAVTVQQGRQKVQLAGSLVWDSKVDLRMNLENVDLSECFSAWGKAGLAAGMASGQVNLTGTPEQPTGTLNLNVSQGVIRAGEQIQHLRIQGLYAQNMLQLQGNLQTTAVSIPAQLSARLPLRLSFKPFRVELKSTEAWSSALKLAELRAERLLPYLPFLEKLGGKIEAEAYGGGSLQHPTISARGLWREGSLTLKEVPHPVENILAEWQADSRYLTVSKAEMRFAGGHVDLKGRVGYPGFQDMQFEALGTDLQVKSFFGVKGTVSGKVQLTQKGKEAQLNGAFRLSRGEMTFGRLENDLAKNNIVVIEADAKGDLVEIRGDEKDQDRYYNTVRMDLGLDLPSSGAWVRGKGLEAEITGKLRLEKAPFATPKLYGELQALRGTYTFQGNALKIVEGELSFWGQPDPDPYLKIICQREVKDVTIQAQVTGPASRPKLALSSIPALSRMDALSYLLFGQPAGRLSSRETSQLQNRVASWLGSGSSTLLKGVLGDTPLAPDIIRFRGSEDQEEGGVIEIGKHVTPDLSVTYGKGVMGEKGNQVQLEYRLNHHLSVQTQVGGTEQSGVDVFWRHDFGK